MSELLAKRYRLQTILGCSSFSEVYEAQDKRLNVTRVIKVLLHADPNMAIPSVTHPNAVAIHDRFVAKQLIHVVMDACACNIADWICHNGLVPPRLAVQVVGKVLSALELAHSQGIFHGDIKAHNLLITHDGVLKIADFGLGHVSLSNDPTGENTSSLLGSVAFMAPEMRNGRQGPAPQSDLFSIAGTLLWMMTGKFPLDLIMAPTQIRECIPLPLQESITRALQTDPAARQQSVADFAAELEAALESLPESPQQLSDGRLEGSGVDMAPTRSKTSKWSWAGGILALALFVYSVMHFVTPQPVSPPELGSVTSVTPCADGLIEFDAPQTMVGGRETSFAAFVDLDGDGRMDALFPQTLDENLAVYWGNKSGQLATPTVIATGRSLHTPAVGDINGDGMADIVSTLYQDSAISVVLATAPRTYAAPIRSLQSGQPRDPALLDWNGDQHLDLVTCNTIELQIRYGDGRGKFLRHAVIDSLGGRSSASFPGRTVAADINEDGRSEILVNYGENILIYYSNGTGTVIDKKRFSLAPLATRVKGMLPTQISISVVDNDSRTELYIWRNRGQGIIRMTNSLNGGWEHCSISKAASVANSSWHSVADFNGDGILDLLSTETCPYCTSNHMLSLGRRSQATDAQ